MINVQRVPLKPRKDQCKRGIFTQKASKEGVHMLYHTLLPQAVHGDRSREALGRSVFSSPISIRRPEDLVSEDGYVTVAAIPSKYRDSQGNPRA
jgi:hypothetical protein